VNTEDQLQRLCEEQRAEIKRLRDIGNQMLAALEVSTTALLYHQGGNLSPATAKSAIESARAAIAKAKGQHP
jgi:hypothetical protein